MNILIASDEKYIKHEKIMLASLRENMPDEAIDVYFLHGKLEERIVSKFKDYLITELNVTMHSIELSSTPFDDCTIGMHLSIETMYRLIATEVLPNSVDKILWLDGDIIINKSLNELYETDIGDYYLCACKGRGKIENYNIRLGLPKEYIYFNAGVLLLNIRKMRKDNILDRFKNIVLKYGDRLTWMDQDILNIAFCQGGVRYLPSEIYNCQIGRDFRLTKSQYKTFMKTCCVMHFAAAAKPWNNTYINGMEKLYWKYALRDHRYMEYVRFMLFAPARSAYKRFRIRNMKQYDF